MPTYTFNCLALLASLGLLIANVILNLDTNNLSPYERLFLLISRRE